jgi:hypothetical protein
LVTGQNSSSDDKDKASKKKPVYEFRKDHDPDGTGKFYMGWEIAEVMLHEGAGWLERPERVKEEEPAKLRKALELKPGMRRPNAAFCLSGSDHFVASVAAEIATRLEQPLPGQDLHLLEQRTFSPRTWTTTVPPKKPIETAILESGRSTARQEDFRSNPAIELGSHDWA